MPEPALLSPACNLRCIRANVAPTGRLAPLTACFAGTASRDARGMRLALRCGDEGASRPVWLDPKQRPSVMSRTEQAGSLPMSDVSESPPSMC
jgi:hypothetical protein